jgi:hypothetical protein
MGPQEGQAKLVDVKVRRELDETRSCLDEWLEHLSEQLQHHRVSIEGMFEQHRVFFATDAAPRMEAVLQQVKLVAERMHVHPDNQSSAGGIRLNTRVPNDLGLSSDASGAVLLPAPDSNTATRSGALAADAADIEELLLFMQSWCQDHASNGGSSNGHASPSKPATITLDGKGSNNFDSDGGAEPEQGSEPEQTRLPPKRGGDLRTAMSAAAVEHSDLSNALTAAEGWYRGRVNLKGLKFFVNRDQNEQLEHSLAYQYFRIVSLSLVGLNCIHLGIASEIQLQCTRESKSAPQWLRWVDIFFAVAFSLELCARLAIERGRFFDRGRLRWNLFDLILITSSLFDLAFQTMNLSFARSLRIFRIVRATRIIRSIKQVRELRLMVASILSSLLSLVWAIVLLVLILYLFTLAILQSADLIIQANGVQSVSEDFWTFYGSLDATMLTLFKAITGGADWQDCWSLSRPCRRGSSSCSFSISSLSF